MGQNSSLALVQGVLGGSLSSNLELDADDGDQSIKQKNVVNCFVVIKQCRAGY